MLQVCPRSDIMVNMKKQRKITNRHVNSELAKAQKIMEAKAQELKKEEELKQSKEIRKLEEKYKKMTYKQIKIIAKEREINKVYSKKKDELIKEIMDSE